jgi:hypothetical protein
MAVYVDPLRKTDRTDNWPFDSFCHLYADTDAELHKMASDLYLCKGWFQDKANFPHYDITAAKREAAIRLGAEQVKAKHAVVFRRLKKLDAEIAVNEDTLGTLNTIDEEVEKIIKGFHNAVKLLEEARCALKTHEYTPSKLYFRIGTFLNDYYNICTDENFSEIHADDAGVS